MKKLLNWRWICNVLTQYCLVAAATVVLCKWPATFILIWLFYGTRQAALAVLGHDAAHRHISLHHPKINDTFAALAFWPIAITVSGYRRWHFPHHNYLGIVGADHELDMYIDQLDAFFPKNKIMQGLCDLVGGGLPPTVFIQKIACKGYLLSSVPMILTLSVIIGGLLWFGLWLPLVLWLIAQVTVLQMLLRIRTYTEHEGKVTLYHTKPAFWVRWTTQPYMIWLHKEHHEWPSLPARTLLEMHRQEINLRG